MEIDKKLYGDLLIAIKNRVRTAQIKATLAANAELIALYWDIGIMIEQRQKQQGWAAAIIPKLSKDLRIELPQMSGFSERNLGRMIAFYRAYKPDDSILPQPVAKLANFDLLLNVPWGHHALLMEKIKDKDVRFWYMAQLVLQRIREAKENRLTYQRPFNLR